MPASINIAAANLGGSGNAATVTFSAVPGYIVASFASRSGGATPTLNAPTVNGNAMTALGTEYSNGSGNRMRLYGYTQSATESVTVTASLDANFYQKGLEVALWTGATASPVSNIGGVNSSGSSISATVSSATGDLVAFHIEDQDSRTLTPGSGSTSVTGTGLNSTYQWLLTEAGAASVNIGGSYPSTTDAWGLAYSVASSASAPVLTSPTGAATGNTTANAGATIDAVSGSGSRIMYALPRIGGSAASSATIISTGAQLAITSAGAKSVPLTGLTPGASYSADVVYVDATSGTSNVVTGTWTQPTAPVLSSPTNTPGSTTALIGATTTVSSGTAYFLPRVGGSAASAATIIATGQSSTVSTTTPSRTVTGLTASTANNFVDIVQVSGVTTSNVVSTAAFTTTSSGDTTPPTLTGSIVIGTVTSSSIQYSWSAGSDNIAVTSYEVSKDGGSNYVDAGNVLTYTFTGLTASTSYPLRVRAKDAAGNVSTPALAATQSTAAASGVGSISLNNAALYTFRKNNGAAIVSTAVTFFVSNVTTGALIGSAITGLSTNAQGVVTTAISNASMLAGTTYRLSYEFSSGEYGCVKLPAV